MAVLCTNGIAFQSPNYSIKALKDDSGENMLPLCYHGQPGTRSRTIERNQSHSQYQSGYQYYKFSPHNTNYPRLAYITADFSIFIKYHLSHFCQFSVLTCSTSYSASYSNHSHYHTISAYYVTMHIICNTSFQPTAWSSRSPYGITTVITNNIITYQVSCKCQKIPKTCKTVSKC